MQNNYFTGMLRDEVGGFQSLEFLDLSNNQFSGRIPRGIGGLGSLLNLSFSGNNFSGTIPDSIGGLASIQSLDLSRNSLSGSLPSALKSLKSLVSLNLSFNAFSKQIPAGLEGISSLEVLDLSWNKLDGGIAWSLLVESKAVHIDLSGNLLRSSDPNELEFLAEVSETVKYLNLSNNQLTGSLIDGGEMSTFGSLKVLDLSYNQLAGPLPGFDYVYDLEVLRLGNNRFDGFLPNGLLKGDSLVLSELDLSANNLSGHIGLITSTTLQVLNLSSNAISGDPPMLIGSCRVLDLSKNQLSGNLSVISKWGDNLEYINLSQNQLTGSMPDEASQFLRLNYLNLSHNALSNSLPKVLMQYPKLTILDLSSNKFGGPILTDLLTSSTIQELHLGNNSLLGSIMFSLSSSKNSDLQLLDISKNHFNGTFPKDLVSLTRLQALYISANNFSGPLPSSIGNLILLTSLDISLNQFTGPLPTTLPNTLLFFNASYNDLSGSIPANLQKFPDSSFHPGNSRLESPTGPSGTGISPSRIRHKHLKTSIKIAIVGACVAVVVILILLAIFAHCKKISRGSHSDKVTDKTLERRTLQGTATSRPLVLSAEDLQAAPRKGYSPSKTSGLSWSPGSGESYPQETIGRLDVRSPDRLAGELYFLDETITLTPEELSRAPAEVLGRSIHGTSYRAILDNGVFLTVKWLRVGVAKPKKEFAKEAKKFANIRHPNVVGLRGYYWGPSQHEKLILSDYISPGSLASFLYDRPGRRGPPLTWAQRLKVAVDVARGLNYLHLDRSVPHGNLKATNVLLDGLDLNARVADYSLHRPSLTATPTLPNYLESATLATGA
ncbi:uncharacterized protein A4U43_C06F19460 [Asparagus officinalis]|uniref:Protein kinase domain-containing protein n=1 Tax=Asparagus officinalis TaxID=4686 RepID=A0A5P1ERK8_ASPOF|nr:uncharacterized protein A4U43_C06F19460 [Asparagus officinalis]